VDVGGLQSDDNVLTGISYTNTAVNTGYYTISVDPNIFDGSNYIVTC
jgi:hypothetical protein